jgi:hypothetical protein
MPVKQIDDILCVSWIDAAQLPSYFEIAKNALSWKGKVMGGLRATANHDPGNVMRNRQAFINNWDFRAALVGELKQETLNFQGAMPALDCGKEMRPDSTQSPAPAPALPVPGDISSANPMYTVPANPGMVSVDYP